MYNMKKIPLLITLWTLFFMGISVQASTIKLPDLMFNNQWTYISWTLNNNYKITYQLINVGTTGFVYSKSIKITCYDKNTKKIYDSDFSISSASLRVWKTTIKKTFTTNLQNFPVSCIIDIYNKIKELNDTNNAIKFNIPIWTNTGKFDSSSWVNNGCPVNTHPDPTIINVCLCDTWYKKNISTNTCENIICTANSMLEWNSCSCIYWYRMNGTTNSCELLMCPNNSALEPTHWNSCICLGTWHDTHWRNYHYYWNLVKNTCEKCYTFFCDSGLILG